MDRPVLPPVLGPYGSDNAKMGTTLPHVLLLQRRADAVSGHVEDLGLSVCLARDARSGTARGLLDAGVRRGGSDPSHCDGELPQNTSTSVTTMAEYLAPELIERHVPQRFAALPPAIFLEHSVAERTQGRLGRKPTWDRLSFHSWALRRVWLSGQERIAFDDPHWEHLPEHEVEARSAGRRCGPCHHRCRSPTIRPRGWRASLHSPRRLCLVQGPQLVAERRRRRHPTMPETGPALVTLGPAPATLDSRGSRPPSRPSPRSWQTTGDPCPDSHRPPHAGQHVTPPLASARRGTR
jgi:hypothetical protein